MGAVLGIVFVALFIAVPAGFYAAAPALVTVYEKYR